MKVTMLSNSKGGLFTTTTSWAKGLVFKGCSVNVFFLTPSEEARCLVSTASIQLNYLTTSNIPNLRVFLKFLFRDQPEIIHVNFAALGLLAIFKKWIFKIPFIYTLHGLPQPWLEPSLLYKIVYTFEHCLLPFVASQSSTVVVVSNYVKEILKKRYGIDSRVIYHGIDADNFKPKNKTESKRRLGYKETDFIILFVGKLHPYKDPLTLVKALSEAAKTRKDLYLMMIGKGSLYSEIWKEISRSNLAKYVKVLGNLSDRMMKLYYDASDVFVLTSINEAFGTVLLEAMASGLPVIASNSGACPEVIGNAGLLFNQANHADLAEKIINLIHDKELSKKLSKAGLKRVKEDFSWEDKINSYWKLYEKAKQRKNNI